MTVEHTQPTPAHTSERRVRIRYALMTLHFILVLTTLVQAFVQGNNALALLIHALSLAALVAYVPAAAVLCYKRRRSSFDHAAGEVAYTAVQCAIWAFSVATAFLSMSMASCTEYVPRPAELASSTAGGDASAGMGGDGASSIPMGDHPETRWRCSKFLVTAILGLVNFALVAGWMGWIVVEVHRRFRGQLAQGFKTSVGCMLRGQ